MNTVEQDGRLETKQWPTCIEGKLLPGIPIPGKKVEDYPTCPDCRGTGKVTVDPRWEIEGQKLKQMRKDKRITLRHFCIELTSDIALDPAKVSRIERGLEKCPPKIRKYYESL